MLLAMHMHTTNSYKQSRLEPEQVMHCMLGPQLQLLLQFDCEYITAHALFIMVYGKCSFMCPAVLLCWGNHKWCCG